jgi:patatin-like phospholipase/acyl hydrolase
MQPYRVLCLDGGGIRGLLTARLLERLEGERPGWLGEVDFFAGTSTGAILAVGLAAGLPISELVALYRREGGAIFSTGLVDFVLTAGYSRGPRYSNRRLARELRDRFGDTRLGELPDRVLVTSFDLARETASGAPGPWKPKIFHNFPGEDSDGDERVVDVVLRSAAAPTYFPAYQGYVDGGVVANNPSVCAVAQALRWTDHGLGDLVVLSLGTGLNPRSVPGRRVRWGWGQWALELKAERPYYELPLIHLMLEGGVDLARYQCEQLLGERFLRCDPALPRPVEIDAVYEMDLLEEVAAGYDLALVVGWLDRAFQGAPVGRGAAS